MLFTIQEKIEMMIQEEAKAEEVKGESPSGQCNTNWSQQEEVLALISCKHKEQTYLKKSFWSKSEHGSYNKKLEQDIKGPTIKKNTYEETKE